MGTASGSTSANATCAKWMLVQGFARLDISASKWTLSRRRSRGARHVVRMARIFFAKAISKEVD